MAVAATKCLSLDPQERKKMTARSFSYFLLLLTLAAAASAKSLYLSNECVYAIYVKTGDLPKAGTESKIGLSLSNSQGKSLTISNLVGWGLMGKDHEYFERGNLDIFAGRGKCLGPPLCKLKLSTDAKGYSPGWYVETIEVIVNQHGEKCSQSLFPINKWMGIDESTIELIVTLDSCKDYVA